MGSGRGHGPRVLDRTQLVGHALVSEEFAVCLECSVHVVAAHQHGPVLRNNMLNVSTNVHAMHW